MKAFTSIILLFLITLNAFGSDRCLEGAIKSIKKGFASEFKNERCIERSDMHSYCEQLKDAEDNLYANACTVFTTDCTGSGDIKFFVLMDSSCKKTYTHYVSHRE